MRLPLSPWIGLVEVMSSKMVGPMFSLSKFEKFLSLTRRRRLRHHGDSQVSVVDSSQRNCANPLNISKGSENSVIEYIYRGKRFYHLYSAGEIFDEGSKTIFWDTHWSVTIWLTNPLKSIFNEPIIQIQRVCIVPANKMHISKKKLLWLIIISVNLKLKEHQILIHSFRIRFHSKLGLVTA